MALTQEQVLERFRKTHGDRYDYSLVKYKQAHDYVTIICKIHGEFPQTPNSHWRGSGCPSCAGNKQSSTEEFISKSVEIHGNTYSYDNVVYVTAAKEVLITCKIHGDFPQTPNKHLGGQGCPYCAGNVKYTPESFLDECAKVHGNKYDYSTTEFIDMDLPIDIICAIHGKFSQVAKYHVRGSGCHQCGIDSSAAAKRKDSEEFFSASKEIHNNKYSYTKVEYVDRCTKVIITCPVHGDYDQIPMEHMLGKGCRFCAPNCPSTTEEFTAKASVKHNNFYTYERTVYIKSDLGVIITCPKHGDFTQTPNAHLVGSGCSQCANEKLALERSMKFDEFSRRSTETHKGEYTYIEESYTGLQNNMIAVCQKHGEFQQLARTHIAGARCPLCNPTGFKVGKDAVFYVYKSETFVGFGVSNSFESRHAKHMSNFAKHEVQAELALKLNLSGKEALHLERKVKRDFKSHIIDTGIPGFRTEALPTYMYENLVDYIAKETPSEEGVSWVIAS